MSMFGRETEPKVQELEGEMLDFVQRDVVGLRHTEEAGAPRVNSASAPRVDNVSSLLQRVSARSVKEIDEIIIGLEMLRDRLRDESARIQHEVIDLVRLGRSTMESTKIIADSLHLPDAGPASS